MAGWVYVVIVAAVLIVLVIVLFTKRKRFAALLLLLLLLLGLTATVIDGRVFKSPQADATIADDTHRVLPGGTIRDGDTVVGEVKNAGDRVDYNIVIEGATQFSLVDSSNKVDLRLDQGENPDFNVIPGAFQYGVGKPGTYHLTLSLPDGETGKYTFRVVFRKIRKHEVRVGDVIKGRFDTPGQVDEYVFPLPALQKVTIADSQPCQDVAMGYTDDADRPLVYTPGTLCWDFTSPALEKDGRLAIVVWSEAGKPADYGFTIKPVA
ncbi:hypothetical protein [Actinocrispum wychmicini]|uniref:Uncharacterized protein n=1 Tax=Actinocrispum wychmicini TaxID=1213861 RepID=A0A4R2JQU3_9PSEU|nr:hypothetical protein [Actinocrispum wychmicini]TCO62611.1 hypothetical protein EV192_102750 [Actinocrispum wychmicini]